MAPRPLPPEQIKTPTGIGINEGEGGARRAIRSNPMPISAPANVIAYGIRGRRAVFDLDLSPRRMLRLLTRRGGKRIEITTQAKETR